MAPAIGVAQENRVTVAKFSEEHRIKSRGSTLRCRQMQARSIAMAIEQDGAADLPRLNPSRRCVHQDNCWTLNGGALHFSDQCRVGWFAHSISSYTRGFMRTCAGPSFQLWQQHIQK